MAKKEWKASAKDKKDEAKGMKAFDMKKDKKKDKKKK